MFLLDQISILVWFLKDYVAPKTEVMMLNIQLCRMENLYNIKKYEIRIFHSLCFYCVFYLINWDFLSKRHVLKKLEQNCTNSNLLNSTLKDLSWYKNLLNSTLNLQILLHYGRIFILHFFQRLLYWFTKNTTVCCFQLSCTFVKLCKRCEII